MQKHKWHRHASQRHLHKILFICLKRSSFTSLQTSWRNHTPNYKKLSRKQDSPDKHKNSQNLSKFSAEVTVHIHFYWIKSRYMYSLLSQSQMANRLQDAIWDNTLQGSADIYETTSTCIIYTTFSLSLVSIDMLESASLVVTKRHVYLYTAHKYHLASSP